MMRRSRSPRRYESAYRRERSFSMSSLSSCSIGKERRSYSSRKDAREPGNKHKIQGLNTRYGKNNERKHNRHEKKARGSSRDKIRDRFQANSNPITEASVDPSICNFHGSSSGVQEEVQDQKRDLGNDRFDRLEKMMEAFVQNRTQVASSEHSDPAGLGELIPRNTNFTTSMWLNKINEECLERDYDEKTCIKFVESKMTGLIKAWYKTLDPHDYTWPELKMIITKTFPDNVEFVSTLRMLLNRDKRQDETMTQYYFSKMYLLEACKVSGVNAVSCLIDGLVEPYLQQEAKAYNFLTPETLYSQYLCQIHTYGGDQPMHHEVISDYREQLEHRKPIHHEVVEEHLPLEKYQKKVRKPAEESQFIKKCFTCGKFGHIAKSCRHAPLCYSCGLEGHIAMKCKVQPKK
ncbi:hypothetical protein JTB14_011057 [Gonioctena quinquepunctata]|nr:hypothetical protein JTB14_011057 [Gonioctena quinquepunctata]